MSDVNLPPFFREDFARDAQGIEKKTFPGNNSTLGENFSNSTVRTHYVVCGQFDQLQKQTESRPQQLDKDLKRHIVKDLSDTKETTSLARVKKKL